MPPPARRLRRRSRNMRWLLAAVAAAALVAVAVDAQALTAQDISSMFPGLSELRREQETKLRKLISAASQPAAAASTPHAWWSSAASPNTPRMWRDSLATSASSPRTWRDSPAASASSTRMWWESPATSASTPRVWWEIAAASTETPRRWQSTTLPRDTSGSLTAGRSRPSQRQGQDVPSIDEDREPITNRPVFETATQLFDRPGFMTETEEIFDRPGFGTSAFEPDVTIGPDDVAMSLEERRRARATADRMCEEYEAVRTRHVSAIPLVPAPAAVSVPVPRCSPPGVPLVVGGVPVSIRQHPHMAALGWPRLRAGGYAWKCGGTLVSADFVLTAAHCSYQDRDTNVLAGPPRAVQLGSARLGDEAAVLARVIRVVKHPRYRPPAAYYDIALLRLAAPVQFSERVMPTCMADPPPPGDNIVATGWGRTEYGGDTTSLLRGVALPVWELERCARALGSSRKLPRGPDARAQLCAGELSGGKDTCQGDSGGPAVVSAGCGWRVVGVTSLGRACGAPGVPALYARALPEFVAAVVWSDRL